MSFLRAVALAVACFCRALAQSESAPQFEVASVKPSPPGKSLLESLPRMQGGPGTKDPERVTFRNYALRDLITKAYDIKATQLSGPAWMASVDLRSNADKFDIDAKIAPGTTADQFRLMLQNLLADRFHLKVHHEIAHGPVYALAEGKSGSKLKESPELPPGSVADEGAKLGPKGEDGFRTEPPGYSGLLVNVTAAGIRVKFMRQSMPELADWLWGQLKKPVMERTGLQGKYDFYLEYRRPGQSATSDNDPGGPDIAGAVQGQLGLKLASEQGEYKMVIVERVERSPTSN